MNRRVREVVIGSHNKDKAKELAGLLRGTGIRVLTLADFPDCPEAVESGRTFEANARIKARLYSKHTRRLTLADDSGLMVNALNGKPGVYSARFAGERCTYADNNRKVLELLRGQPRPKRGAKFVCVVALYDSGRAVGVVRGVCSGRIAVAEKGRHGFGYDPVFIPSGQARTFAQLGPRGKARVSHRSRALRRALRKILSYRPPL
ncbi:MAG: dITP/XTP pyrophosphatase [Candidatus Omnitrophica bacterium]|nr:dITP/XTP pyrophosphatase [Candidatus Omnitrophota bacterium]